MSDQARHKWAGLPNPSFCNGKTKLAIWDFDGTLFNSPDREQGMALYLAATGEKWPFDGWWGRLETLMPPIVPDPIPQELLIREVHEAYLLRRADPACYNVLLTGRPYKNRRRVQEILVSFGILFDEEYYRGMRGLGFSQDTFEIKAEILRERLLHPDLQSLEIWEDRPEHVLRFTELLKQIKSRSTNVLGRAVVYEVGTGIVHEV